MDNDNKTVEATPMCGNCQYAIPIKDNVRAVMCRRYPPSLITAVSNLVPESMNLLTVRPSLAIEEWCGEWELSFEVQENIRMARLIGLAKT